VGGAQAEVVEVQDQQGRRREAVVQYRYFCGVLFFRIADLNQSTRKIRTERETRRNAGAAAMFSRMNLG
jgi:hypothetical protein